ncbi:tektin-B1-like [Tigriopus californicus]|uniref:tektin-B1-like n=1 Tax=Tigriopus californicus TaxID=6832 RepID=UPI0027DA69E4|nr:tektin-B1-like [Tigriopus californicus]|eukprot:TCALIF_04407-PA protein Name:"Similar to Tekt2 Tektin-2 (Rattus norvegicus)" AED:0.05 eAED:0.05 QI:38/1/1/1/1/1/5/152/433
MSGARTERPINRYQPPDWHSRNEKLAYNARETREQSLNLRKEAQLLKNETENRTKWYNFENNMKLSQRAMEIERWQRELEKLLHEVEGEAVVLDEAKEACERSIEALTIPLDVATECISLREGRREYEVVRDPVEHDLQKENQLIERIRIKLKDVCEEAWDQLAGLEDVRQRLETDLEDKTEALKIDLDQLRLTEGSAGLSHKPNPTRIPAKSVRPEAWNDFSMTNKSLAERMMIKSQKLREYIFRQIEQTTNDLKVQTDSTNFDFRKRMYEMRRAKDEIEYQMRTTRDEIQEQENNNRDLELAIQAKEGPLKLAETRLENRTTRPHVELCTDLPLEGLIDEVEALKKSIHMLEDKLDHSRETLSSLQAHLRDLNEDFNRKSQALSIDQRCVDIRDRLKTHDQTIKNQTERNMKLAGTLRKTQRYLENSTVAK